MTKQSGPKPAGDMGAVWKSRIVGSDRVDPRDLDPHPLNHRQHPVSQRDALRAAIREVGFIRSVTVNRTTGHVLDGHLRLELALEDGESLIDVEYVELSEAEERLVLATFDQITAGAEVDAAKLDALLQEVQASEPDLQRLLADMATDASLYLTDDPPEITEDEAPEPPADPVTRPGDLWILGNHRLLCGDSTKAEDVARLMDGERINVAFTSPPYASQRKYDESSGFKPIPPDEYVAWFEPIAANVKAHLESDGSWFVNIKPHAEGLDTHLYVHDLVAAHVRLWGWHFATEFAWERNGVPKRVIRRFKNQFEPVYQFTLDDWKMRPDNVSHASRAAIRNGGGGNCSAAQGSSNVVPEGGIGMAYPGNRLPTFAGTHEATGHSAAFPVGLPGFFLKAFSDPGDAVYEPFSGSGTTIIAAEQLDRRCYAMEISPAYCDVAVKRWKKLTGQVAERVPYE